MSQCSVENGRAEAMFAYKICSKNEINLEKKNKRKSVIDVLNF